MMIVSKIKDLFEVQVWLDDGLPEHILSEVQM